MNLEDLAFGWREALLGAVALLVLYAVLAYRRLHLLKKGATSPALPESAASPLPEPVAENDEASPATTHVEASFPWNEPPDPPEPGEPAEAALLVDNRLHAAEAEITTLRGEVAALSEELAELRDEVKRRVERVQASQHVAPIYGDAMQMAVAGYDAAAIAERCGVARAEAELVVALIRNREGNEPTMRER
jgi:hypothetical protein